MELSEILRFAAALVFIIGLIVVIGIFNLLF